MKFWCKVHGLQPLDQGRPEKYAPDGSGPFHPYHRLLCRECGRPGAAICDGRLPNCKVLTTGICETHKCLPNAAPVRGESNT